MRILVAYDISQAKRLRRVAKVTLEFGRRVQKSVFECDLDEGGLQRLKQRLAEVVNPSLDSVRFYRLCARCSGTIEVMGTGPILQDESVVVL